MRLFCEAFCARLLEPLRELVLLLERLLELLLELLFERLLELLFERLLELLRELVLLLLERLLELLLERFEAFCAFELQLVALFWLLFSMIKGPPFRRMIVA